MKIGYVMVFGKFSPARITELTVEEINKSYKQLKEMAENYGLKVLLWGSPLGMYDESVVVFDVGESMDNYVKFLEENYTKLPFTDIRSHPIVVL